MFRVAKLLKSAIVKTYTNSFHVPFFGFFENLKVYLIVLLNAAPTTKV